MHMQRESWELTTYVGALFPLLLFDFDICTCLFDHLYVLDESDLSK